MEIISIDMVRMEFSRQQWTCSAVDPFNKVKRRGNQELPVLKLQNLWLFETKLINGVSRGKFPSPSCASAVTVKRLCDFVQKTLKLYYVVRYMHCKFPYITLRNLQKPASPHHEKFPILLRNASRYMLICACLLSFLLNSCLNCNRAPYLMPLYW